MKKILIITVTMAFLAIVSASKCSAADNTKGKSLRQQIEKSLYFPNGAGESAVNAVVYVSFIVNENNKIAIQEISGSDALYSNYVTRKLSSLNLKNVSAEVGKVYVFKLSFQRAS